MLIVPAVRARETRNAVSLFYSNDERLLWQEVSRTLGAAFGWRFCRVIVRLCRITTRTLPCINARQIAAKITLKRQHTLGISCIDRAVTFEVHMHFD